MTWVYSIERSLGAELAVLAGIVSLLLLLASIHGLRRAGRAVAADRIATVAIVLVLAGVAVATLQPVTGVAAPPWQRLILDPVLGASDGYGHTVWRPLLANVVLFVPLGALVASRFPGRGVRVWLALVVLSIGVESAQYVLPIGRIANAADVVANGGGAALGVGLDALVRRIAGSGRPRRAPAGLPEPVMARKRP